VNFPTQLLGALFAQLCVYENSHVVTNVLYHVTFLLLRNIMSVAVSFSRDLAHVTQKFLFFAPKSSVVEIKKLLMHYPCSSALFK
jgi:hypothetical protein